MTEKRFDFKYDGVGYSYYLCDKEEGASYEDRVFAEIWADKSEVEDIVNKMNALHEENQRLKEYEKYVGDVKREELDRVFKMSIYEIAEAFEYYEKRIKELGDLE